jgi:D-aminopeptidase
VRLSDLGLSIGRFPQGRHNAITDVSGVSVGHCTIVSGDGPLLVGAGPVRTGVTVIRARPGSVRESPVFAGAHTLNGNGECTGLEWLRESGLLTTDIALTNTHSVGVVRDAHVADHARRAQVERIWSMPVVAETYDGTLNDINGQHVRPDHVRLALDALSDGPVPEGAVGGGTGMICHEFKGGIGTASRVLPQEAGGWTVAALVQANYGRREDLRVAGLPVGAAVDREQVPSPFADQRQKLLAPGSGSIIIVIATDAPLLPDQCRRLAERATVGLARVGGGCSDSSGDIFLAFATGNSDIPPEYYALSTPMQFGVTALAHQALTPLFEAAADATEEAILNAMLAADTVTGRDGITAHALPVDVVRELAARAGLGQPST